MTPPRPLGHLLSHRERRPQEVEAANPKARDLAPPEAEDGAEVGHQGVVPESLGEGGQLVGGNNVPLRVDRGREFDAPARRPGDQIRQDSPGHHGREDRVLASHGVWRQLLAPGVHQRLNVGWRDGAHRPGSEGGKEVGPDDDLVAVES